MFFLSVSVWIMLCFLFKDRRIWAQPDSIWKILYEQCKTKNIMRMKRNELNLIVFVSVSVFVEKGRLFDSTMLQRRNQLHKNMACLWCASLNLCCSMRWYTPTYDQKFSSGHVILHSFLIYVDVDCRLELKS